MDKLSKGLVLGGIFASEALDKSAESVSIKGLDISSLNSGRALANSEHKQDFQSTVGRVINAKKVFTTADCDNAFEKRMFKDSGELPCVIGYVELFDDDEHEEGKAIASIAKHFQRRNLPMAIGFSVEGGIIDREGGNIKKSIARKVAVTATECNAAAKAEIIGEMSKSEKSVYEKISQTSVANKDSFLLKSVPCELLPSEITLVTKVASLESRVNALKKALEAGMAVGSKGSLIQGAALQKPAMKVSKQEESTKGQPEDEESTIVDGLKPINKEKAKQINDKKDEISLDVKLKKADTFAASFFKNRLIK